MRLLHAAPLLLFATMCSVPPEPPRVEIVSFQWRNEADRLAVPKPGHAFATLRVRHAAASAASCELDWNSIVVVDRDGRRYLPARAGESRGKSSESGLFGRKKPDVVHPHEISAVYEVPVGTQLTRAAVGEWFPLPSPE